MLGVDFIVIIALLLFLLSSKTRATALVLLFAFITLYFFALEFDGLPRYSAIGTIELLAGLYLISSKRGNVAIAETLFILVFINVIGGVMYWNYQPPTYYDNMCLTMSIIQILILAWRLVVNGKYSNRSSFLCPLLCFITSNVSKRYHFMRAKKAQSKKVKGFK